MNKDQTEMWNRLKEPEPIINQFGTKRWVNKAGELHRDNDQPAIIFKSGTNKWYKAGQLHRENDKPAVTRANGYKAWYINGKCIRREYPNE